MGPFGAPNVDRLLAKRDVKRLVRTTVNNDPLVRREAVLALGRLGDPVAFTALMHRTGRLGQREAPEQHQPPREPDPTVHAAALSALGSLIMSVGLPHPGTVVSEYLGQREALDVILVDAGGGVDALRADWGHLAEDEVEALIDARIRETARTTWHALAARFAVAVGDHLLLHLEPFDPDCTGQRRNMTAWQWYHSSSFQFERHLIRSLGEPAARVMFAAAGLHPYRGLVSEYVELLGPAALDPAVQALDSPIGRARKSAVLVLGHLGDRGAIGPLVEALAKPDIAQQVAHLLEQQFAWAPTSVPEQGLWAGATGEWVGSFRNPCEDLLWILRSHPAGNARAAAAIELARMGGSEAIGPLRDALADEYVPAASAAVEALGELGAVEPLIDALQDHRDFRSPSKAVWLKHFRTSMGTGDVTIAAVAAKHLGGLADKRAVRPLIRALDDAPPPPCHDGRGPQVLFAEVVAEALGKLADPSAIEPLVSRLGLERSSRLRDAAVEEILEEALRKLRHEPDGDQSRHDGASA